MFGIIGFFIMFGIIGSIIRKIVGKMIGQSGKKIKATAILEKSDVPDFNMGEFLGKGVSLQLVSAVHGESANALKGKVGKKAYLENLLTSLPSLTPRDSAFEVTFEYEEAVGTPGAIIINNNHSSEFFLKSITLENVPGEGLIHFDCNSSVYPAAKYGYERVFFGNKTYLRSETPAPLLYYRDQELERLRGDGKGERKEWDRIYDYDVYNDLGEPDKGADYARQILGGSSEFPYPRRGRTGRPRSASDPKSESRMIIPNPVNLYVPRDERFGHLKMSDFLDYALKSQWIKRAHESRHGCTKEWDSFENIYDLFDGGLVPASVLNVVQEILRTDGEQTVNFPTPEVIKTDKWAWRTDAEFGREMLAGVNPVVIKRLNEFPPTSKLDSTFYGDHNSEITKEHIEKSLEGKGVLEALDANRLYILDHHDTLMPYLNKINSLKSTQIYASRTILFLKDDGTLKPVAIELSLPHPDGYEHGAVNDVYTPAEEGVQGTIWLLAKAYVAVNDSGIHQLISHWLNTHAVMEPTVIATNRQLSVAHPIYKLLQPHFRDTMFINGLARQTLINAGGVLESTTFPGKYAMEMSAVIYKSWALPDHALPADLLRRGVAVPDSTAPNGVRLLIEDYPYAVDGLEIWSVVKSWVKEYTSLFYKSDEVVQKDTELQAWWKELREVGHADKKDEPWWPKMQTCKELVDTLTTLIWISSAHHAAVNFGQYSYGGFIPCRPTVSRRFMPKKGTPEFEELETNPDAAFLKTITTELQTILGILLLETLSRHTLDEVYRGQRFSVQWTEEPGPIHAFERFGKKLKEIEDNILRRNKDAALKNRAGPANVPYTLLFPTSEPGLTTQGIPNSISI